MPPRNKTKTEDGTTPAPRRPTRAKTVKVAQTKSEESDPDSDPPPLKKGTTAVARHTGHQNVRGRRGGLADMPNMPLDVLIEIFGFLSPHDLLSLARTSRDFRAFLMSRAKSLAFWKAARQQIEGLPDIPAPLSEPAYANLLFFNHCHVWLSEGHRKPSGNMVPVDTLLQCMQERYSWQGVKDATIEEKKQFIEDRKAFVAERKKVAERLEIWEKSVKAQQDATKEAIREDRFTAVLDKLREEGWGEELDKMEQREQNRLHNIPAVCRPNKLTERGWCNMRTQVIEFMEQIRSQRLHAESDAIIKTRLGCLKKALYSYTQAEMLQSKDRIVYAKLADCAMIPEIRAVLEDTSQDVSAEQTIAQLIGMFPALVVRWNEERKSELATIIVKVLGNSDAAGVADPLNLALAHFMCRGCSGTCLRFPAILGHPCFRTRLERSRDRFQDAIIFALAHYSANLTIADTASHCMYEENMRKSMMFVREVIEACGCDPDSVTFAEMETCEGRLRCLLCAQVSQQTLFTWQSAIEHTVGTPGHHYVREPDICKITGEL
ncbi:hypothetical protein C8Q80DRAFT_1122426 [Daedaleopsis nitida]|nr:hypothetical protein C8Q80DRAFT_1122426 [Daedaleopsis nitida]